MNCILFECRLFTVTLTCCVSISCSVVSSHDNTIFMTAKTQDPYGGYWDTWSRAVVIVKYDQQNDTWHNVYQMKNSREEPTAAAVPLTHGFLEYCQFEEN